MEHQQANNDNNCSNNINNNDFLMIYGLRPNRNCWLNFRKNSS